MCPTLSSVDLRIGNKLLTCLMPCTSLKQAPCRDQSSAQLKEDAFPLTKINSVTQQAHGERTQLDKEKMDNLIATGSRANATHFFLLRKPTRLPNGKTDEEAIQGNNHH